MGKLLAAEAAADMFHSLEWTHMKLMAEKLEMAAEHVELAHSRDYMMTL